MPAVISADGSRVALTTGAKRLVANDTNGLGDAFVRDAATNTTLLASVAFDGDAANGNSGVASLSENGRYAVFTSQATDVVPGSTTTNFDVYRRDLQTNTTVQVTVRPNGAPSSGGGATSADVSADGSLVAFTSSSNDLAPTDDDGENDLFIRDRTAGQTRWLSVGLPAGASPTGVVIAPNGQWISSRWDNGSLHLSRRLCAARRLLQPTGTVRLRLSRKAVPARPGHRCRHRDRDPRRRRRRHHGDRFRQRAVRRLRLEARRRRAEPRLQGRALTEQLS